MEFLALLIPFFFVFAVVYAYRRVRDGNRRERVKWGLIAAVSVAVAVVKAFDDYAVHWAWWGSALFCELSMMVVLIDTLRERSAEASRRR